MRYYKIQFPPYNELRRRYLSYKNGMFRISGSPTIFSDEQITNDIELIEYLKDKEYKLVFYENRYHTLDYKRRES